VVGPDCEICTCVLVARRCCFVVAGGCLGRACGWKAWCVAVAVVTWLKCQGLHHEWLLAICNGNRSAEQSGRFNTSLCPKEFLCFGSRRSPFACVFCNSRLPRDHDMHFELSTALRSEMSARLIKRLVVSMLVNACQWLLKRRC
jgi:hypothetical protein